MAAGICRGFLEKKAVYTSFSENWPLPKGPGEGMECPLATGDRIQARYGTHGELRDSLS